jgi:hypothetical protein
VLSPRWASTQRRRQAPAPAHSGGGVGHDRAAVGVADQDDGPVMVPSRAARLAVSPVGGAAGWLRR